MHTEHEKHMKHMKHIHAHIFGGKISAFGHNPVIIFLASLIWLIMRSGRRPSRLAYPCQQTAAMTVTAYLGFVFIILGRWLWSHIKKLTDPKIVIPYALILLTSIAVIFGGIQRYNIYRSWKDYDLTREILPVGIRLESRDSNKGAVLFQSIPAAMLLNSPHRVVSVHSSDATNWAGSGNAHNYINQEEVNKMVREGLLRLTGETDYINAWRKLIPYQTGEIVAIKLNCNNWCSVSGGAMDPYAPLVNAVISGLTGMGVPAGNIWLVDPSRGIGNDWKARITNQNVIFAPHTGEYVPGNSPYASTVNFTREGPTQIRPGVAQKRVPAPSIKPGTILKSKISLPVQIH